MSWDGPLRHAVLEVTNRCNLRCRHCASDSGEARPGELPAERFVELVGELAALGCEEVTLLGGEVLLHPSWGSVAEAVRARGLRLVLITNGLLVDDRVRARLQELRPWLVGVSLDGPDPERYRLLRGVDGFERVRSVLDVLLADGHPHVNAITTFTRTNLPWWDEFVELFDGTEVTWQVQLANKGGDRFDEREFVTPDDHRWLVGKALAALDERPGLHVRFMDDFGWFPLDPRLAFLHQTWHGCMAGRELVGIHADGRVSPCLSLGDRFAGPSVAEAPLADVWRDDRSFRALRERSRSLEGACAACPHGAVCGAGCAAIALSATGGLHENPYCIRRIETEGLTRRVWGAEP